MYIKYQLIAIALLFCLALTITPAHGNNDRSAQITKKSVPEVAAHTNAEPTKSVKAPQVTKQINSGVKNKKKEAAVSAQPKKAQETVHKAPTKTSAKTKVNQKINKKALKQVEKSSEDAEIQPDSLTKDQDQKQVIKGVATDKQGHSFGVLLAAYSAIFAALIYGLKYIYFPKSNNAFEILLDIIINIKELNSRNSKRGYKAPQYHQEVDDSNSITVGYTQDHAKQLFWQKNSVQGI